MHAKPNAETKSRDTVCTMTKASLLKRLSTCIRYKWHLCYDITHTLYSWFLKENKHLIAWPNCPDAFRVNEHTPSPTFLHKATTAPMPTACSAVELLKWPQPKLCIAIEKRFLDKVKRARESPIEVCVQYLLGFLLSTDLSYGDLDPCRRQQRYYNWKAEYTTRETTINSSKWYRPNSKKTTTCSLPNQ